MTKPKSKFSRNILIAVDDSDNSLRAVNYVGQMLARVQGFRVTLLIVPAMMLSFLCLNPPIDSIPFEQLQSTVNRGRKYSLNPISFIRNVV